MYIHKGDILEREELLRLWGELSRQAKADLSEKLMAIWRHERNQQTPWLSGLLNRMGK